MIQVSVIEDAGNEVDRRAAGHERIDVDYVNGVQSAGSFGTRTNFLVVVSDVGVGVADPADLFVGNCMLLCVDIRRPSRLFEGLGFLALHLIDRSASDGNDANIQTLELVDDPFARWAGLLGRTPQLGELLGLLGLALGFGDGESAECNGTAGPLRTFVVLQCRVKGVRFRLGIRKYSYIWTGDMSHKEASIEKSKKLGSATKQSVAYLDVSCLLGEIATVEVS